PDRPARELNLDLHRRQPLEHPVVPLVELAAHASLVTQTGETARLERASRRARQHEREPAPGEPLTDGSCLLAAPLGQRDVGQAGVSTSPAPLRLAVPDEDDVRQSSSSVSGPSECAVGSSSPELSPSRTRSARWRASSTWSASRIVSSVATTLRPTRTSRTTVLRSLSAM